MPKDLYETFDECFILLQREFIIAGSDEPPLTRLQIEIVLILVNGGVNARDIAFAIAENQPQEVFDNDHFDNIMWDALKRRADINGEIQAEQK